MWSKWVSRGQSPGAPGWLPLGLHGEPIFVPLPASAGAHRPPGFRAISEWPDPLGSSHEPPQVLPPSICPPPSLPLQLHGPSSYQSGPVYVGHLTSNFHPPLSWPPQTRQPLRADMHIRSHFPV